MADTKGLRTTASSSSDSSDPEDMTIPEIAKSTPKKIIIDSQLFKDSFLRKGRSLSESVDLPAVNFNATEPFAWPLELVLVRHGESEGNLAQKRGEEGDQSAFRDSDFKHKHSSSYRLTDIGVAQAKIAGKYIKENIGANFDRCYTSEYVRAMETASLLDIPNAEWYTEIVLRERDKGNFDNMSKADRRKHYSDALKLRKRDAFFWRPPNGESLAQVCVRVDHTFNTLRRECKNQRVLIVCHGEVMWSMRVRIERLSQLKFHKLKGSKDPKKRIHNSQIIHYTRVHPETHVVYPDFRFMRSICPWNPDYSNEDWHEFNRPTYSTVDLKESVTRVPRFVNNTKEELQEFLKK
eukprot:CAMPEP_0168533552 /NCGR_PEP_ID=MMETSP0405-20121227/17176_1 /TAXON_ID=498012 /ORGANISM="Trichosphaerium sp, Strain Am-I-7 wt" /LENGTH=350 /DNA_ID=CAMNT_0008559697 /DNA_START=37 /DNA_END=1086 /DNA_ORIENTATION=+